MQAAHLADWKRPLVRLICWCRFPKGLGLQSTFGKTLAGDAVDRKDVVHYIKQVSRSVTGKKKGGNSAKHANSRDCPKAGSAYPSVFPDGA